MTDQPPERDHLANVGPGGNLDLDSAFTYHPPTPEQIPLYETIRSTGKTLASLIARVCPPGPDRSTALRKVRESVMWANAAIATAKPDDTPVEIDVSGLDSAVVRCGSHSGITSGYDGCVRRANHDISPDPNSPATPHVDEMGNIWNTGGAVGRMGQDDLREVVRREGTGVRV